MIPISASPTAFLLTWFLHSSLCLLLCWALERAGCVRGLRTRECLWRAALFGSLVAAVLRGLGLPAFAFTNEPELGLTRFLADASSSAASLPGGVPPPSTGLEVLSWTLDLAGLAWIVGVALGLLRWTGLAVATGVLARRTSPAPDALLELWRSLCAREGRTAPRLALSSRLSGPISLPTGTVLLPPWVATDLDRRQQEALLLHELAHATRRDALWHLLGRVFAVLLWPQPFAHLARHRLERLGELSADQWALSRGAQGRALARCLIACASRPRATPSLTSALYRSGTLSERVEHLLSPPASAPLPRGLRAAAWAGLVLVATGTPGCDGSVGRNGSRTSVTRNSEGQARVSIERGGDLLLLESDAFELRPDLGGVSQLAPGGRFRLELRERGVRTIYSAEREGAGLREEYTRGGASAPLDAAARAWIGASLERIGRESSFDPRR